MAFVALAAVTTLVVLVLGFGPRSRALEVTCAHPVVSPVTGTRCLYFEHEVIAKWRGEAGPRELRVMAGSDTSRFSVGAEPGDPARFELVCTFRETKGRDLRLIATSGDLEFGPAGYRVVPSRTVGGVNVPPHATYEVIERVVPLSPRPR